MVSVGDRTWPFDIKLTTDAGGVYGFMLSQDQNGKKNLQINESEPPNFVRDLDRFSEVFRQSNPRNDTPYVVNDLSGGVGQLYLDDGDPTKYWWSTGIITHVKGKVFPAPPLKSGVITNISTASQASGRIVRSKGTAYDFMINATDLYRRPANDSTTAWTKVYTAPSTITDVYHCDAGLIIAVPYSSSGTIDFYIQSSVSAAATWTPTSYNHTAFTSSVKPEYFVQIRDTVYANFGNDVYFTTDITSDAWVGPIVAGPSLGNHRITSINNFLFMINSYGIYSIDSEQNVEEVVWQFKDSGASGFGSTGSMYHYAQFGTFLAFNVKNEVFLYNPFSGEIESIGLSTKDSFSVSYIYGIAADIYNLYVLAGVDVADSYTGRLAIFSVSISDKGFTFEVLNEEAYASTPHAFSATIDTSTGATRLYIMRWASNVLYTKTLDVPSEWDYSGSSSFATSAILFTSISKSNYPGFDKQQLYADGNFLNLTDTINNRVTVYYSTTYGNGYTLLDNADSTYDDGHHIHFLVDYDNVVGETFNFELVFHSDGTTCPILLDLTSHQRVKFKYQQQIIAGVKIGDDIYLRDRNRDKRKIWTIWDDLKTLRTTTSELLYEDFLGNSFNVTFDMLSAAPSKSDSKDQQEMEAILVLSRKDGGE